MDGIEWIRVLYAYPINFTDELIETLADSPKIIPYLDLPLQHINDRVLKRMQRRVNRAETEELLGRLRQAIPGLALRTTFIVGFPGETEAEFEELCDFVKDGAIRAGRRLSLFLRAGHARDAAGRSFARGGQGRSAATSHGSAAGSRLRLDRSSRSAKRLRSSWTGPIPRCRATSWPAPTPTPRTSTAWCVSREEPVAPGDLVRRQGHRGRRLRPGSPGHRFGQTGMAEAHGPAWLLHRRKPPSSICPTS